MPRISAGIGSVSSVPRPGGRRRCTGWCRPSRADSDAVAQLARFLGHSGNYTAARVLQQQITDTREQVLGTEHPSTLATRAGLSYWTGRADSQAGQ